MSERKNLGVCFLVICLSASGLSPTASAAGRAASRARAGAHTEAAAPPAIVDRLRALLDRLLAVAPIAAVASDGGGEDQGTPCGLHCGEAEPD